MEESTRVAGLPCYPPLDLQYALDRACYRWRVHAFHPSTPAASKSLRAAPLAQQGIHVLGTNHLLPWHAARVAEAALLRATRSKPLASIAIELAPSRLPQVKEAAGLLDVVLSELAHRRFQRMPDMRALQRLTGSHTRTRLSHLLHNLGIDSMDLRLFGFVEGMELMQAVRVGQLLSIPVVAIDQEQAISQSHSSLLQLSTYTTDPVDQGPDVHPACSSSTNHGTDTASQPESAGGRAWGVAVQAVGDSSGTARDLNGGQHTDVDNGVAAAAVAKVQPGVWQLQAHWRTGAWQLLEAGVDRGLVEGDVHACCARYISAWSDPAALAPPWRLQRMLQGQRPVLQPAVAAISPPTAGSLQPAGGVHQDGSTHLGGSTQHMPDRACTVVSSTHPAGNAHLGVSKHPQSSTCMAGSTHHAVVQEQRELYMAQRIISMSRPVLAVMGAAHVAGVERALRVLLCK